MAVDSAGDESVPALPAPSECDFDPTANASAAADNVKVRYADQPPRPYDAGGILTTASMAREFVCTYCERGQCARCNDHACTCCYGNEDS